MGLNANAGAPGSHRRGTALSEPFALKKTAAIGYISFAAAWPGWRCLCSPCPLPAGPLALIPVYGSMAPIPRFWVDWLYLPRCLHPLHLVVALGCGAPLRMVALSTLCAVLAAHHVRLRAPLYVWPFNSGAMASITMAGVLLLPSLVRIAGRRSRSACGLALPSLRPC